MRRREFIAAVVGCHLPTSACSAQGQQRIKAAPRIGVLLGYLESDQEAQARLRSFQAQLTALGWRDGQNVQIDYRFPGLDVERIRAAATDLITKAPDVLFVSPAQPLLAVRSLLAGVPVVFANLPDPVALGLVASLSRALPHPGAT